MSLVFFKLIQPFNCPLNASIEIIILLLVLNTIYNLVATISISSNSFKILSFKFSYNSFILSGLLLKVSK